MSNIKDVRCKPGLGISWSMAAKLYDVVVVVGRTRPRSVPLAMLTMKKELHGFLFLCMHVALFSIVIVLRLAALRAAGAPLTTSFEVT